MEKICIKHQYLSIYLDFYPTLLCVAKLTAGNNNTMQRKMGNLKWGIHMCTLFTCTCTRLMSFRCAPTVALNIISTRDSRSWIIGFGPFHICSLHWFFALLSPHLKGLFILPSTVAPIFNWTFHFHHYFPLNLLWVPAFNTLLKTAAGVDICFQSGAEQVILSK